MGENRKVGIKKVFENIIRPFKVLAQDGENSDKQLEQELMKLEKMQSDIRSQREYASNIKEEEIVQKVEVKNIKAKEKIKNKEEEKER